VILRLTEKEYALRECAHMILHDQCPPKRKHYLCMGEEDDTTFDCSSCWYNYLQGIAAGTIELPKKERRLVI
jgi:hypothetical protein